MKRPNFPNIKGFEFYPEGRLLEQSLEMTGRMGVAYERSIQYVKYPHSHDRPNLAFPRGACVVELRAPLPGNTQATYQIDSQHFLFLPAGMAHDHQGISTVYDNFSLFPEESFLAEAIAELGHPVDNLAVLLQQPLKLKRSQLLEEMVDRYFIDRILKPRPPSAELRLLEKRLAVEIVRVCLDSCLQPTEKAAPPDLPSHRALHYIEANLFNALDTRAIGRHAGTSPASLFRHFKEEFGLTPFEYIRNRRLDESLRLLKSGKYPVGDVALLVGYEDFGAFSKAFKRKFRQTPSSLKK